MRVGGDLETFKILEISGIMKGIKAVIETMLYIQQIIYFSPGCIGKQYFLAPLALS